MIAVDTNVVIRLLTKDDPQQFKKAFTLFKENRVFLSFTVIQETEWVLRFSYEFSSDEINFALSGLLGLPNIETENLQIISNTLSLHADGYDFSDALHLAQSIKCDFLFTFDKKFVNKAKDNPICQVKKP